MKITIYSIDKRGKKEIYDPILEHFKKLSKRYAQIEIVDIFNNEIAKAQDISAQVAQKSYTNALEKFTKAGYNIALDPNGAKVDSFEFAKLLQKSANISFFIGGAYGFDENMLNMCDFKVSFGKITMSHKLAKVVLMEQVYRGLAINNNHPYHK